MRILGIDPGLRITGFGILDKVGQQLSYVASGCIKTSDGELQERLKIILVSLREVIAQHQTAAGGYRKGVCQRQSSIYPIARTSSRRGHLLSGFSELPVAEYTALQVKQAVVGNGHAKKEQVQDMVQRLLKLSGRPSSDAADALACAICHAHGGQGLGALATAGYRVKNGRLHLIGIQMYQESSQSTYIVYSQSMETIKNQNGCII